MPHPRQRRAVRGRPRPRQRAPRRRHDPRPRPRPRRARAAVHRPSTTSRPCSLRRRSDRRGCRPRAAERAADPPRLLPRRPVGRRRRPRPPAGASSPPTSPASPLVPLVGAYNIPAARLAAGGIAVYPRGVLINTRRARRRDGRRDGRPPGVRAARPRGDDDRRVDRAGGGPGTGRRLAGPDGLPRRRRSAARRRRCRRPTWPSCPTSARRSTTTCSGGTTSSGSRTPVSDWTGAVIIDDVIAATIRTGMIPAYVYSDPDVFELERERLFGAAWVFLAHESEIPSPGDYVVRRVLDDSFIVVRDEAGDGARALQHVPAPRDAGVPGRARQRLALPLPVPRLVVPQRRRAGRAAVPPGRLRRRRRPAARRAPPPAGAAGRHDRRDDLRQPGRRRPDAARAPRRLRLLPRPVHPPERRGARAARPAALAGAGELEDRLRELRRRHVPHAVHAPQRRRHRAVPRAQGEQAQGGRALLRRRAAAARRTSCRRATSPSGCATSATPTR